MHLAVPHTLQQNTKDCGVAVAQSLLEFYELPVTRRSLLACLPKHSFGSHITELADCLLQHGLQTTLVSANPYLFSHDHDDQFREALSESEARFSSQAAELMRVMELGVLLKTQIPSLAIIKAELGHKRPVIVSLNRQLLNQTTGLQYHYVIVVGFEKDDAIIVDPASVTHYRSISATLLQFSMTSITSLNPFAGTMLLAKPKPTKHA